MASTVASIVGSNRVDTSSFPSSTVSIVFGGVPDELGVPLRRTLGFVENAIAYSPEPLLAYDPVRATPRSARVASLRRLRSESGASVATTTIIDPLAPFPLFGRTP